MNDVNELKTLAEIVMQRAKTMPDFEILTYLADGELDEQPLTYRDFDHRARLIAGYLQQQGLEGERVLLLFPQGLEYMIALFGCFYAGVIAVPAYPPRNNRNMLRLLSIMDNCQAANILTDLSGKEYLDRMDQDFSDYSVFAYEELLKADKQWQEREIAPDDIAYLQYTSGSTGTPKGVIIRHINMMVNAKCCHEAYASDTHCAVNWLPMFHDMGLIIMMSYLIRNVRCVFMSPTHFVQKPIRWLKAIERYRAEFVIAPNFAYDLCCEKVNEEQAKEIDLSSLTSAVSGSERVRLDTIINFYNRFKESGFTIPVFTPCYGLAEATLVVSVTGHKGVSIITPKSKPGKLTEVRAEDLPIEAPGKYHVSAGHPVKGAKIKVVDPETKTILPPGKEGEIWLHFPNSLSSGYWNDEIVTAETFYNYLPGHPDERYLRTGDLGFVIDSEIFISGRLKDMIIIRGQNYYPHDIELTVAQAHEALQLNSGAAFYIEENGEERLAIVHEVRRAEWRKADPDAVIQAVRQALSDTFEIAPYYIALIFPLSLPKTSSGKVQRQKAKTLLLENKLRVMKAWKMEEANAETPLGMSEINPDHILGWLVQKIAQRARIEEQKVLPDSGFGDFPLESVDAAELSEDLSKELGFTVEAESFWSLPSLQALSEYLYEQYLANQAK